MEAIRPEIVRFASLGACCEAMGREVLAELGRHIARQGFSTLVLPGGRTPVALFARLRVLAKQVPLDWGKVFFFFGDERCLPLDHGDSNYAMAREHLLAHLPIEPGQVFPMPVMIRPATAAARRYQETMTAFFASRAGLRPVATDYPAFDLVLLGMGEDGHTASLFADQPALTTTGWVATVTAREAIPPVERLTLTLALLNQADTVFFLVGGPGKRRLVDKILGQAPQGRYPASLVRPRRRLVWYLAP